MADLCTICKQPVDARYPGGRPHTTAAPTHRGLETCVAALGARLNALHGTPRPRRKLGHLLSGTSTHTSESGR